MAYQPREKRCARCQASFIANRSSRGWQKYCSPGCMSAALREKAIAAYPPREDLERLYLEEGLSDREIAKRYPGRSYAWVFNARRHYGIRGRTAQENADRVKKPGSRPTRSKWGIRAKGELACRNCGQPAHHLHHIVPRSRSRAGRDDMERNGMALCFACHRGFHDRRITIWRKRLKPEELEFALAEAGPLWVENNYPRTPDEVLRRTYCLAKGRDPEDAWTVGAEYTIYGRSREEIESDTSVADALTRAELDDYDAPPR